MKQTFDLTKLEEGNQITDDYGTLVFTKSGDDCKDEHHCNKCAFAKHFLNNDSFCYMHCEGGIWKEINWVWR